MRTYLTEHPNIKIKEDVLEFFKVNNFEDSSWVNDVYPSFTHDNGYRVWIAKDRYFISDPNKVDLIEAENFHQIINELRKYMEIV